MYIEERTDYQGHSYDIWHFYDEAEAHYVEESVKSFRSIVESQINKG